MRAFSYMKPIAVFSAIVFAFFRSLGAGPGLTGQDIQNVKSVCQSLIGIEDWRAREFFRQHLMSYVRSKHALEEAGVVECSLHCGGTLKLRGDADIYYGFSNQPPNVSHRIDTVALHVHGKRALAIGPGTEYYPYPYYEVEHRTKRK
jgi:hypothetical protein